ncbi:unnamed protein product [Tuber melanosporum]|uniref:(Perigord truffle) hypothetical protein n=1 Tax=Tuber melanosporum (strain Mel28) TaxID=656061 RepID=D5G7V5_TUBMM|nr:uncharacterized protein GSTUM_00002670001 [Tuber melanosporum]CAZ80598.1 unnamed protein product [Tuber melanosporum]
MPPPPPPPSQPQTPHDLRLACRNGTHTTTTSLSSPTVQCNLLVLPSRYAPSFTQLCARNPVSCPLLYSTFPGSKTAPPLAVGANLATDLPRYNVYRDGKLVAERAEVEEEWTADHVGFLIGCSYSFEWALSAAGFPPKHTLCVPVKCVPMFRTAVPLAPAGEFTGGCLVVSMRAYRERDVAEVRRITRAFRRQHGEPVAWGWAGARMLGIEEKVRKGLVDFGEWVGIDGEVGEVPVFWGCGVTPQVAVMESGIQGVVISHVPGCMFVTDVPVEEEEGPNPKL